MRSRDKEKRKAVEALQNKENNRPRSRRRLIEDEEEEEKEEEGYIRTSTAPRSKRILRARQHKQPLLNDDEDSDNEGFSTLITATSKSSRSRSTKDKEKIKSQNRSFASKTSGVEEEEDDNGITTTPNNEDSDDVHNDDVHNDDDGFWPDESYGDMDSSEDEYADETEIGGTHFKTVLAMRQACESNQYNEMIGRAAQFGKRSLAQGDQEQPTADTFKGPTMDSSNSTKSHPGSNHNRTVLSSAVGGLGAKVGLDRVRSHGKTSKKGGKRQLSDPNDDDDSTSDPSSSEITMLQTLTW
ncbi:hypothetical protein BGZ59_011110 [Podila verticillata]|uniref:Uncharacterized protein n=1 Tax=Podila verticillata NRRL 6337 TaxID=1069443 RepID=A0A086TIS8_9FUNG|nr:hypothetical protein BGZ59_011110 [Podila verticillata]KFH61855.1 hypothetical protein MVEG_12284 [Podila verticillata NRRL 6337]